MTGAPGQADPPRPRCAAAVVVAAGAGTRMGPGAPPKPYLTLIDRPALAWTLDAFERAPSVDRVVLVIREGDEPHAQAVLRRPGLSKVCSVVRGGRTRRESVYRGLREVPPEMEWVVVHDGARPLVTAGLIEGVLAGARESGAATAFLPVRDTVKRARDGWAVGTLDRSELVSVQTPQAFRHELIRRAHELAAEQGFEATDDAALVEGLGARVRLVPGHPANVKLTLPEDIPVAEALLAARSMPRAASVEVTVGVGYDIHRLARGRPMILGGVAWESEVGPVGHSDGDVITHAVIDAMLGGAGLGDIGRHFPDTDPRYAGADSLALLRQTRELVAWAGFRPTHVDVTLIAERPKLTPYADRVRERLAAALLLTPARVNVKGKTHEGLGPIGQGEGIAALATVTLLRLVREGAEEA